MENEQKKTFNRQKENLETSESPSALPTFGKSRIKKNKCKSNEMKKGYQYKCPECGNKSACSSAHAIHLLCHRDESEWPFECQLCEKKMKTQTDLNKHYLSKRHILDPRFMP